MNKFLPPTLTDVCEAVGYFEEGYDDQFHGSCPCCEADEPDGHHFYFKADEDDESNVLMYCHRCRAEYEDLVYALEGNTSTNAHPQLPRRGYGMKAISHRGKDGEREVSYHQKIKPIENYDHTYYNPDGSIAYFKHRVKYEDGHKEFRFHYTDENGVIKWAKPPNAFSLYNLHLMHSADSNSILFIVEGEKCADAMVKAGFLATTTNTGANKRLKLSAADMLIDKFPRKIVIGDNDDRGADYVNAWKAYGAIELKLENIWPSCPHKGDVADYFEAGLSSELIADKARALLETASPNAVAVIPKKVCSNEIIHQETTPVPVTLVASSDYKGNYTTFKDTPLTLKCGMYVANEGVYLPVSTKSVVEKQLVSPIPLLVTAILYNITDSREKVQLSFFKHNTWKSIFVMRSEIANKTKIVELANIGIEITSTTAKLVVDYLQYLIANNRDLIPYKQCSNHLGWHGNSFLPCDSDIAVDTEGDAQSLLDAVTISGNYEVWLEHVKRWRKNTQLRIMMAASFASILLQKLNFLSFIFHVWGGSETGKTLALKVVASVWGNPTEGALLRSLNTTSNALTSTARFLNHLPLFGNELQTLKHNLQGKGSSQTTFDSYLYNLTEGIDRARAGKSGNVKNLGSWRTTFIFNGEEPIVKPNSDGGAINRVIELHCTSPLFADLSDKGPEIADIVQNNFGHAGPLFVGLVKSIPIKELQARLQMAQKEISAHNITAKQTASLAVLKLADDLVAENIFQENILPAELFADIGKSKAEIDTPARAFNYLISLIISNRNKFDGKIHGIEHEINATGTIWGKGENDGSVKMLKSILTTELAKEGYDFNSVKHAWERNGWLVKKHDKFASTSSISGHSGVYVYLNLPNNLED